MNEDSLGGKKFDSGKPQLSMCPLEGLIHEAKAFEYGAEKYGRNNYKLGMKWSRLIDASLRHIHAFANKEDLDKESLIHHLGHAKATIGMLLYYIENKKGEDDR